MKPDTARKPRMSRIEAATARLLAAQAPYVPNPARREETTREVARNRARDVVNYGSASRSAVEARAAVDCAREPWLIRDLYVATFIDALRERGAAIVA